MATISEHYGLGNNSFLNSRDTFIIGVECEIESINNGGGGFWERKEDHSLRNHGWEFVSPPAEKEELLKEFERLQDNMVFYDYDEAFSERTSTHVHVNCQGIGLKETRNIILLYALFEEIFFSMVKPERRDNIHCVPLTETHLPARYARPLQDLVGGWSKYTALNILPLQSYGTIEFRHLHGTGDKELLKNWLDCLERLWKLGQTVEINAQTVGNPVIIDHWYGNIFPNLPSKTPVELVSNSLIDLKLAV